MIELGSRGTAGRGAERPSIINDVGIGGKRTRGITYTPDVFTSSLQGRPRCLTANDKYSDPELLRVTAMSDDERASLMSIQSLHASPDSITSKHVEFPDQTVSL